MDSPLCPLALLAPLLLVRLLCSSPERAERAKLLSLYLFYHSFVAQFSVNMMYSSSGICQCGKRGKGGEKRSTNKCRGMSLAGDGCAGCQRLLPTCDADGRDAPALSLSLPPLTRPSVRLFVLRSIISPITAITIAAASVVRESGIIGGEKKDGRTGQSRDGQNTVWVNGS